MTARELAREYHRAWTHNDTEALEELLADDLEVDAVLNEYPTKQSYLEGVARFGPMVSSTEMIATFADDDQALNLYDMDVGPLGRIRIAEHFTVADGKIAGIRHVHDSAPFVEAQIGIIER